MMRLIAKFRRDEAGAITVDWVILSAGVIALAIGVVSLLGATTTPQADNLGNFVSDQAIATSF